MANPSEIGNFINRKVAVATLAGALAVAGCGTASGGPTGSPDIKPSSSPVGAEPLDYTKLAQELLAQQALIDANASTSPSIAPETQVAEKVGVAIPVLSSVKDLKPFDPMEAPQGEWFNPIYNVYTADKAHDWVGIGPWYPVTVKNLDAYAANFTTHGNPGELIVQSNQGGRVEVAFWQIDAYQDDGSWGHDKNGKLVHNPDWDMQYTFKGVPLGTVMHIVDADTGEQLTWEDGSPIDYLPSDKGDASFAIPETNGNDVRWGVVFEIAPAVEGEQKPEIKIERGPNDHPELKGENPLSEAVIKPMVPGTEK